MIILANEQSTGGFQDDAHISAYEEAVSAFEEDWPEIGDWLEENMNGRFKIVEDYDQNGLDVNCIIYIEFDSPTDEMAFKLRWL